MSAGAYGQVPKNSHETYRLVRSNAASPLCWLSSHGCGREACFETLSLLQDLHDSQDENKLHLFRTKILDYGPFLNPVHHVNPVKLSFLHPYFHVTGIFIDRVFA